MEPTAAPASSELGHGSVAHKKKKNEEEGEQSWREREDEVSSGLYLSATATGGRRQGPQRHSPADMTKQGLRPDIVHDTETRTQAEHELKLTSTKNKASNNHRLA
jgi:hypothetical protein